MPTLHRFVDRPGYFVKGVSNGKPVTFQLTPERERYLTETLNLDNGAKFSGDTLKWLYRQKWAVAMGTPPVEALPPAPAAVPTPPPVPSGPAPAPTPNPIVPPALPRLDKNPIVFQGVVHIHLTASDHVLLDQSAEEVVRTLVSSEAVIAGPFPLPVHIEAYTVVRDGQKRVYELRLYQRLLLVRNPRGLTVKAMNEFSLSREVDVKIEMQAPSF